MQSAWTVAAALIGAMAWGSTAWAAGGRPSDPLDDELDLGAVVKAAVDVADTPVALQVVAVVGVPRSTAAARLEEVVARELLARRLAIAAPTSRVVPEPAALDRASLIAAASQVGAAHVLVLRVLPPGGEVLVQLVDEREVLASRLVRVGPHFSLPSDAEVGAEHTRAALKAFERRALELKRTAAPQNPWAFGGWGTMRRKPAFEVWSPEKKPLDRAEALRRAGEEELATREAVIDQLLVWSVPLALGSAFGLMAVGFAGAFLVGIALPPVLLAPTTPGLPIEQGILLGLGGMFLGLAPPLAMLVATPVLVMLDVDDEETLAAIQAFNRAAAEEVGLDEGDIPPRFLGY